MTCLKNNKHGSEILLSYGAGTLDAAQLTTVENHAAECAECRSVLSAQKRLWNALDEMDAPGVSPDFDERLYARIYREEAASWKISWVRWLRGFAPGSFLWNPISWRPVAACAAAAVVLATGLYLEIPKGHPSSLQIRPESVSAEQMDVTIEDLEMLMPPASAGRM
jgi:hypothetical protein